MRNRLHIWPSVLYFDFEKNFPQKSILFMNSFYGDMNIWNNLIWKLFKILSYSGIKIWIKFFASRFGPTFISGKSAEIFPFFVCFNKRGLGAVQLFPQPSFPYNFCLWPRTKHARTAASKWSQNLNFFGLFKRSWMNNESTNWPF